MISNTLIETIESKCNLVKFNFRLETGGYSAVFNNESLRLYVEPPRYETKEEVYQGTISFMNLRHVYNYKHLKVEELVNLVNYMKNLYDCI